MAPAPEPLADRLAVTGAFLEDLVKVTALRAFAFVVHAILEWTSGYNDWLRWYDALYQGPGDYVFREVRELRLPSELAFVAWLMASFLLVVIYRVTAEATACAIQAWGTLVTPLYQCSHRLWPDASAK
jgi:hypothetical protein